MYVSDDNVIPCNDNGNHLASSKLHNNTSSHCSNPLADNNSDDVSVTLEENDFTEDSATMSLKLTHKPSRVLISRTGG
jgi:hypothetical protein